MLHARLSPLETNSFYKRTTQSSAVVSLHHLPIESVMMNGSSASPSSSLAIESGGGSVASDSCDSDMDPDILVQTLLELEATKNYRGTIFAGDHNLRARRRKAFYLLHDMLAKNDTTATDQFLEENVPRLLENILVDIRRSMLNHPFDTIDHDLKEYSLRAAILFASKEEMHPHFSMTYTRELVEAAMSTMSDAFQIAPLVVCYACVLVNAVLQNMPKDHTFIFPSRLCETLVCLIVEAFDEGTPFDSKSNVATAQKNKKGVGLNTGIAALETLGSLLETHGQEIESMGGSWATCVFPHLLHSNELVRASARVVMNLTCKLLWPAVPVGIVETCYMALEGPPLGSELGTVNVETGLSEGSLITNMAKKFDEAPSDVIATWGFAVHLTSSKLYRRNSRKIVNGLCKVALKAFASKNVQVKVAMYSQWRALIDVFAQNKCFTVPGGRANKYVDVMAKPMLNKFAVESSPLVREAILGAWGHFLERLAIAGAITEHYYSMLVRPLANYVKNDVDLATRLKAARVLIDFLDCRDQREKQRYCLPNDYYLKCLEDTAYGIAASQLRASANGDTTESTEWIQVWRVFIGSIDCRGRCLREHFALYISRVIGVLLNCPDGQERGAVRLTVEAIKSESIYNELVDIFKKNTEFKAKIESWYPIAKSPSSAGEEFLPLYHLLNEDHYVQIGSDKNLKNGKGLEEREPNIEHKDSSSASKKRKYLDLVSSPDHVKLQNRDKHIDGGNKLTYEEQAVVIAEQATRIAKLQARIEKLEEALKPDYIV